MSTKFPLPKSFKGFLKSFYLNSNDSVIKGKKKLSVTLYLKQLSFSSGARK